MTGHCGQAACVAKQRCESQGMQHEVPGDASGLATAGSFGCAGAGCSIACEELATTTSTVLRRKSSVPLFRLERRGALPGSGGAKTYSWSSSRQRALEAAPLCRSSAPCSTGTTGVKATAELFEQVDAVGSAVGTTRAAVRRPIPEARDVLFRKGLKRHHWAGGQAHEPGIALFNGTRCSTERGD
jgi:hypothetical protein